MAVRRAQRGQSPEGPGALCQPSATLGLYCVATLGAALSLLDCCELWGESSHHTARSEDK